MANQAPSKWALLLSYLASCQLVSPNDFLVFRGHMARPCTFKPQTVGLKIGSIVTWEQPCRVSFFFRERARQLTPASSYSHCSDCRWPAAAGPSSAAGLLTPLSLPVRWDPEDGGRNPPKWKPGDGGDSTASAVTRQAAAQHYFPSPARWTSTYIFLLSHMGWEMRALCWPSPAACSALSQLTTSCGISPRPTVACWDTTYEARRSHVTV